MAFVVVFDACALYPFHVRDVLLELACEGLFQARWSDKILDEAFLNLVKNRPELEARVERTRARMMVALPDACVPTPPGFRVQTELPDPKDNHVLETAVLANAQTIVTFNLKDFPASVLGPLGIEAQHPDVFLCHTLSISEVRTVQAMHRIAARLQQPKLSLDDLLTHCAHNSLPQFAVQVQSALADTR